MKEMSKKNMNDKIGNEKKIICSNWKMCGYIKCSVLDKQAIFYTFFLLKELRGAEEGAEKNSIQIKRSWEL